jgi:hypothetical protein
MRKHTPRLPGDGDTKPCPRCQNTLVFSSRYALLSIRVALVRTDAEHIRYARAWVCRNGGCDYREIVGDE